MTKPKINPAAVGVFIAGAIVILFASLVLFGSGRFFRKTKDMLLTFREPVAGLDVGAPVKLMGVNVGDVKRIAIEVAPDSADALMISVVIQIDRELARGVFREYTLELENRSRFDTLVKEKGMRGRLEVLSLLSGQLYVSLDLYPGQPGFQLNRESAHGYWEIPTLPSSQRELMQSLVISLRNLTELDFKGLSTELKSLLTELRAEVGNLDMGTINTNLTGVLTETRALIGNPELTSALTNVNRALKELDQLAATLNQNANPLLASMDTNLRKAGEALDEATQALRAVKRQLEPGSPLTTELITTLDRAGSALNALRQLAEELQRNPSSIITGKQPTRP